MTTRFYITPYDPAGWRDPDADSATRPQSDLYIWVSDFTRQLRRTWHRVNSPPFGFEIEYSKEQGVSGGFMSEGNQILALEVGESFNEFVLWYRGYVPSEYPLYLFPEGDWDSLRLTSETTLEDIAAFTGL
jgi:hypothetical protein